MNVNYYFEFFLESLLDFYRNRYNEDIITLPESILNNSITLKSFYTDDTYCLCAKRIFEALDIPYSCTEIDINNDLSLNFMQHYQMKDIKLPYIHVNLQNEFSFNMKETVKGFPNANKKAYDEIEYMVSIQNKEFPFIVAFNAYNVDMAIWERLYGNLFNEFNIILFTGNYGLFGDTPGKINAILESECINKQVVALTWCSGFKVFAQFNQKYPGWFSKLYAVTGNYNNANGVGKFSDFEKSTLALTSLMDAESMTSAGKVFMYFFSKQAKNPFGIPSDVWPIISAKLTDKDYFTAYLNSMKELSQYDLLNSLNYINFPMTNIMASNDVISKLSNNEIIDKAVGNCKHIMLNFATHWCLLTHADQISEIIKS